MSDSSSLSEVEVSPSSDSLDTLIGLSKETGRTTAVTLPRRQRVWQHPQMQLWPQVTRVGRRPPAKKGTIEFKMATQAASL